jgi:phosphatidate cytidylyltransferase
VDDHDEYEPGEEAPVEPGIERVRIIGATPAGSMAGTQEPPDGGVRPPGSEGAPVGSSAYPDGVTESADSLEESYRGFAHDEPPGHDPVPPPAAPGRPERHDVPSWLAEDEPSGELPSAPELLHWADPPTGQVPAVLDRRGDDDEDGHVTASGDAGPAWREHQHEWDDSAFDPSLLANEQTRVGALEERPLEERQPWEFDSLGTPPGGTAVSTGDDVPPSTRSDLARHGGPVDEYAEAESQWPATEPVTGERPSAPPAGLRSGAYGVSSISSSPLRESTDPLSPAAIPGARRRKGGRRPPPADTSAGGAGRNVPTAIATGVAIAAVALACFKIGTVATLALATVVLTLAAAEAFAGLRRSGSHPATLLGLVATVAVVVTAYSKGVAALPLVLVLLVITSMVWYLVGAERGSPVEGIATTVFGFAWVGLLGSFAGLLLAPSQYPHRHGIAFLFGAVVATVGADVGALVIGGWRGRHALAPRVSPHKTWEGFAGGTFLAIAASAAITGHMYPWTPGKAAVLGLVVAVVAPVGDLCESLLKRDLGLKDMGSLLPGHGGVLDRVDALLFVLPATYYLVRVLHLG